MLVEEHHKEAVIHFELAAKFYKNAQEYHLIGEFEKSSYEVQKAQTHHKLAKFHINEVAKLTNIKT